MKAVEHDFTYLNNPYKYYSLGVAYKIRNDDNNSIRSLIQAIDFGVSNNKSHLNTMLDDSIGSSISILLRRFPRLSISSDISYKLVANAYMYLSSAIHRVGTQAYESYENRSFLLNERLSDLTAFNY